MRGKFLESFKMSFFEYKRLWKQSGMVLIVALLLLLIPIGSKSYLSVENVMRPFILISIIIVFALTTVLTLINAFQKAREDK
ncbi:hypothetical protein CYJ89_05590 [Lactobacillus jensenii]|nr:hypothetical protein BUE77_08120 [Lactobacillus jensenii]ERJ42920.1 hypothetical protein N581_10085 [Lactobacillus jensenii MD IIE-70(2)]PLA47914.1 hypothetical protein CYJ89_05590 [Lactobacillus jensenii]